MSSINNLPSAYLQSILSNALQGTGLASKTSANSVSSSGTLAIAPQQDTNQLSPLARLLSTLQQLQQSDTGKYQQVTQQIATTLQSAAQTAQADGNSTAANQLNQLAADFTSASKSGQLPSIQDLAHAVGGHHHHHAHAPSADADNDPTGSSSSISSAGQTLSDLPLASQTNGTQNQALNPIAIILNTLSSAGITVRG
jgi:hypothetical protein